jgi:hypothetical protein
MSSTIEQMLGLLELAEDWDSYGAPPISPGAVGFALAYLARAMRPETPAPAVVPSPSGGLQFEWHDQGVDLEVESLPTGRFEIYIGYPAKNIEEWVEDIDLDRAIEMTAVPLKHLRPR